MALLLLPRRGRLRDEPGGGGGRVRRWLEEAHRCTPPTTELGQGSQALFQFPIPRACFEQIVTAAAWTSRRAATRRSRTCVLLLREGGLGGGLASIEIFEYRNRDAHEYAVELGVALQLTGILRYRGGCARGATIPSLEDLSRFRVGGRGAGRTPLPRRPEVAAPSASRPARTRALRPRRASCLWRTGGHGVRGADGGSTWRCSTASAAASPRPAPPAPTPRKLWVANSYAGPRTIPPMRVVVIGGGFTIWPRPSPSGAPARSDLERRGLLGSRAFRTPSRAKTWTTARTSSRATNRR